MRWVWILCVTLAACGDRAADTRMQQLEQELTEIRRQAARDAVSPLADAMRLLQQQQQLEESRTSALASEFHQLGTWLRTVVPPAQQETVRALEDRLSRLEAEFAASTKQHAEQQAMLLQAVEASVGKLEQLLQRLGGPARTAVPAERQEPDKQDASGGPWWPWLVVIPVLLLLALLRRDGGQHVGAEASASSKPAPLPAPRGCRITLRATRSEALVGPLGQRLAREPLVLVEPSPTVRAQGDELLVDFHLAGYAPPGTESRVEAELRGLALDLGCRARGTAA